jgi:DNA-binding Lrp family transcriptional regulator
MFEDYIDRSIIGLVQGDLPLQSRPFLDLAQDLGISEAEIVARVRSLQGQGILRRWGAVLRHRQAGFVANAMVAWKVEASVIATCARCLTSLPTIYSPCCMLAPKRSLRRYSPSPP